MIIGEGKSIVDRIFLEEDLSFQLTGVNFPIPTAGVTIDDDEEISSSRDKEREGERKEGGRECL